MATNREFDAKLVEEAKRLGKHRSKRDAVNAALVEYIAHRQHQSIVGLFATMDWNPDYDYKAERRHR